MRQPAYLLSFILLTACGRQPTAQQATAAAKVAPAAVTVADTTPAAVAPVDSALLLQQARSMNRYLAQFNSPVEYFTVEGQPVATVQGVKGTQLTIVPDDLETEDGAPATGKIAIALIELSTTADFVRNNAPTTADGRLLQSGGAYYINCSAGGKQLRLKQGRTMAACFPRLAQDKGMQLFYGSKDAAGAVNWKKTAASFTAKAAGSKEDSLVVRVPVYVRRDTVLADVTNEAGAAKTVKMESFKAFEPMGMKVVDGRVLLVGKTNKLDTQYTVRKMGTQFEGNNSVYEVMQLTRLEWINCDRYPAVPLTAGLTFGLPAMEDSAYVTAFIIFPRFNSVAQEHMLLGHGHSSYSRTGLPGNEPVKIIAVSIKDGQVRACMQLLTLQASSHVQLDLKSVSKMDLVKMLST